MREDWRLDPSRTWSPPGRRRTAVREGAPICVCGLRWRGREGGRGELASGPQSHLVHPAGGEQPSGKLHGLGWGALRCVGDLPLPTPRSDSPSSLCPNAHICQLYDPRLPPSRHPVKTPPSPPHSDDPPLGPVYPSWWGDGASERMPPGPAPYQPQRQLKPPPRLAYSVLPEPVRGDWGREEG